MTKKGDDESENLNQDNDLFKKSELLDQIKKQKPTLDYSHENSKAYQQYEKDVAKIQSKSFNNPKYRQKALDSAQEKYKIELAREERITKHGDELKQRIIDKYGTRLGSFSYWLFYQSKASSILEALFSKNRGFLSYFAVFFVLTLAYNYYIRRIEEEIMTHSAVQQALEKMKSMKEVEKVLGNHQHYSWFAGYDVKMAHKLTNNVFTNNWFYPCDFVDSKNYFNATFRIKGEKRDTFCTVISTRANNDKEWTLNYVIFSFKGTKGKQFVVYDHEGA